MTVGMMWFDRDHGRPLSERMGRAVDYYRSKYGLSPNRLFLHPQTAGEEGVGPLGDVEVCTSPTVLPDHFWIGVVREGAGAGSEEAAAGREFD